LLQLNDQLESTVETRTQELRQAVDRLKNEIARREGAETDLHKRSKMLEGFFELTATPLAFLDASFKLLRVNKAFSQATGIDPNHLSGRNYFECFPDCRAEPLFKKVIRTETAHREFAKPYIFPGSPQRGTTYWNWTLAPLINNKEKIEWLVLNLEDVTEREKAIYELNRRTKQLQKLTLELSAAEDRERNRLSEILHDDLQQILVAAKFNIAMLQNHPQDAANRIIAAEVEHMISDAIQKSRSLSHELSPTILHRNDFSEIMRWLVDQVYTTQGLEVRIEVKSKVLVQSDSLRAFLYKSVQELLFNVVKHARVHHAVLKIRKISRYICISVIDQGRGFDPASLNESEGFGIFGIRERAELLGGRMRIKSAKGAGSNLTLIVPDLELPIVNRPLETHYMDPATREQNRLRILIADDHEIVREGLASLLSEQKDMEVVAQAGNGREAVHLAGELRPDVVVMDASMPLMNGDEATRQIKAYLPQTRVVVLSMFEQEEMVQRMYRAGVQGYVLKTAPPDELLAAIRSTAA
jgi:PAS domain S-box-containing protein